MAPIGAIACGHPVTAGAAEEILREGGNAFDAAVAAHFTACVAEPVLASLGGGGFLLADTADGRQIVYDFFAQTPRRKRPAAELEFHPITADFGTTQQVFHIGLGAIATPGAIRGMFHIHRQLCSLPMARLLEPAIHAARDGVRLNGFQAYAFDIVRPIYSATAAGRAIFGSPDGAGQLLREGDLLRQPQLAGTLEALAREGDALFYTGDIARLIGAAAAAGGGHLTPADLAAYRVIERTPLRLRYRGCELLTNPPPSSGGILIGFALKLLEALPTPAAAFGSAAHLVPLAEAMGLTNQARIEAYLDAPPHPAADRLLDPGYLASYQREIRGRARSLRGTTHVSVMDASGNVASLTLSNGEGCGHLLPDTGIMLNNMLGEEDLNPAGFHAWPEDQRMTSMMAPSLIALPGGQRVALGSGGSNRLRTAILQVLVNLIDFRMDLVRAVDSPRIHFEGGMLNVEGGFDPRVLEALQARVPEHRTWPSRNLFFGGVHSVLGHDRSFVGRGDPRRGGVGVVIA